MNKFLILSSFLLLLNACAENVESMENAAQKKDVKDPLEASSVDSSSHRTVQKDTVNPPSLSDTSFVSLFDYPNDIALEFRYADTNNFLHEKVYDCANCVLRKEVIEALLKVNQTLMDKGYRLRLFDCYRPLSVQFKMWEIFPDGRYVANPNRSGSIHNRGGAVDLTLETSEGKKLDMGTDFDHFGKEAHLDYLELPDTVLSNRNLLKKAMIDGGFSPLKTEWWHFNYQNAKSYTVSNFPITCD